MLKLCWFIPLFPALAFLVNGLMTVFGVKNRDALAGKLAVGAMVLSTLICLGCLVQLMNGAEPFDEDLYVWMGFEGTSLDIPIGFRVDTLTAVMLFVVGVVGTLIFVYATEYMRGDLGYSRFFTYFPLFTTMMFILVLANSLPLLFVGWEGVGLCSYLLIGYFFDRDYAAEAGKKAFIVNRIGDAGFLLGMAMIYWSLGSLRFADISANAAVAYAAAPGLVLAICLLLFLGAAGKSAQIPLFVWLPDAMAGPTPVSALIHAATMVTAGVYMMCRLSALYTLAPAAGLTIALVGAGTALLTALIALSQREAKRILAYSTISQLGFMVMACGVGAYTAAIFHLMTHAFFKACLFLGSGCVLHAFHEDRDVDVFRCGGLRKYLPTTRWTFLVACVAIAGVPPLAGFFSKDEILWETFKNGYQFVWLIGLVAAFCTAFYMLRLYTLLFSGEFRGDPDSEESVEEQSHHLHESPALMTVPVAILAVLAIVGGWVNVPHFFPQLHHFLAPAFEAAHHAAEPVGETLGGIWELGLAVLSVLVALFGILLARVLYLYTKGIPTEVAESADMAYDLSYNKFYIDEFYNWTVISKVMALARKSSWVDDKIIIAGLNGLARFVVRLAQALRPLQTGYVQHYALAMLAGLVFIVLIFLLG